MKEKIKKVVLSKGFYRFALGLNWFVLGFGIIDNAIRGNYPTMGAYSIAFMWFAFYVMQQSHMDTLRKLLDGAMEGWKRSLDELEKIADVVNKP